MKTSTIRTHIATLVILALTGLPGDAHAWFGRERARLLKQADTTYEEAREAGAEGRVLDEIAILTDARALYGRILSEHPGYKGEHVDARFKRCGAHLRIIAARIKSGEISIPGPDAILEGAGEGYVDPEAAIPAPSTPAHRTPIPPLVDTVTPPPDDETAALPETPDPEAEKETAPPVSDFSQRMPTPVINADEPGPGASDAARSALERADPDRRIRLVHALIDANKAADAVLLLEDIIEKEGDDSPTSTRLLFVRSLLECRNYQRAERELTPLMLAQPPLPAARSLASTLALQKGNLAEALYQMDRLVHDHPCYSDAYVNMAYVYFLMNPEKNREMAVVCYKSGLSYGAGRDPAFETALGIEIID